MMDPVKPKLDERDRLGLAEHAAYGALLLISVTITALSYVDRQFVYGRILNEDGPIESATAVLAAVSAVILFRRAWRCRSTRGVPVLSLSMALGFTFIAGEEISWGQRIFGFETPEMLAAVNTQKEFTVHNIALLGIDFSKDIFGKVISVAIAFYLALFPPAYSRWPLARTWLDRLQIPVPAARHLAMFLLCLALVILMNPGGKKWELYEFALSVIFLFIVLRPGNRDTVVAAAVGG